MKSLFSLPVLALSALVTISGVMDFRPFDAPGLVTRAQAQQGLLPLGPRPGWSVVNTTHSFAVLSRRLDAAVEAHGMIVVTEASASEGAKGQGIRILGNRIAGVYRNDFARRMLAASVAAGIEAPIRFYLVETQAGQAMLAYRLPSDVFAPYFAEAGSDLKKLASELDVIFAAIARDAIKP